MNQEPRVAVVVRDSTRRRRVIQALTDRGLVAEAASSVAEVAAEAAVVVLGVQSRAELEVWAADLSGQGDVPFVVMAPAGSDIDASQAFRLGAADFVTDDVLASELVARVETRARRPETVGPPSGRHRGAAMVLELTQALSSALELREILYLVVRRIAEVIDVDRVSIVLFGADDVGYVIAASDDRALRDLPIRLSAYPEIGKVLARGEPLSIIDAKTHPLFDLAGIAPPRQFRSLTLYPIRFEGKPMGVLFLRFAQARTLSAEDDFLLNAIANATGIAMRNATLLTSLREQSRSAHAEAQKRLRALQRYLDFFDSSADGILVVALDGEVLFCNPAACRITAYEEGLLRGSKFDDLLTAEVRDQFGELQAAFADGVFPNNVDLPIRAGNGKRRVLNVSFNSVLRADHSVIVSLRDVTEERALARELTKTKEFLQRVIDSSVDAIVSADMQGNILLFNPAAERTLGFTAAQAVESMNVRQLYTEEKAREIMQRIRSEDDGGAGVLEGYATDLVAKSGALIPVQLSAALIVHRGRPIGTVGVFKDLRARREIEEQLAEAHRELEVREKKAFIAELAGATAHELNQPLTTIMGYAGLLQRQLLGMDDQRVQRAILSIVTETERMAEIVRKIGKLTKYETKPYVGDTRIIDIEKSIDDSH
jgi:PAS domain S-box-containing protein